MNPASFPEPSFRNGPDTSAGTAAPSVRANRPVADFHRLRNKFSAMLLRFLNLGAPRRRQAQISIIGAILAAFMSMSWARARAGPSATVGSPALRGGAAAWSADPGPRSKRRWSGRVTVRDHLERIRLPRRLYDACGQGKFGRHSRGPGHHASPAPIVGASIGDLASPVGEPHQRVVACHLSIVTEGGTLRNAVQSGAGQQI